MNINLIRDRKTGKSKGFGFLCYENQLSTDLAVDNFNGTKVIFYIICQNVYEIMKFIKILGRMIRCDHAGNYRPPKEHEDDDEITKFLRESGCQGALHPVDERSNKIELKQVKEEKDKDDYKSKYGEKYKERKKSRSRSRDKDRKDRRDKSKDRDKSRDRDRKRYSDRDRERSRDRRKERSRSRDRYRSDRSYHKNDRY